MEQGIRYGFVVGLSLAKVVYRSKKDYKDGKPTFTQVFRLTLLSFSKHRNGNKCLHFLCHPFI